MSVVVPTAQLRAEWRRLVTVRSSWAVLAVGLLVEAVLRTVSAALVPDGAGADEVAFALRPSIAFLVVVALLPLLLAGGEWRWGTATSTYALRPRRGQVLAAKAVVGAVTGLATAAVLSLLPLALQVAVLAPQGLSPTGPVLTAAALGPVLAGAPLGVLGVALGTLVREQSVALTVAVGLLFVAPLPLLLLGPAWYAWTPTAWVDALAGGRAAIPELPPPAVAAVLLAVTAGAALVTAWRDLVRRDVA